MATINTRQYSTPRNINLKGQGSGRGGILLFESTNPSDPIGSSHRGLYINTSGDLVYANQGTTTVLGSGGGGTASLDGAYDQGRSITVDAGEIAFNDSTVGAAHTFAINKTGAGSGNLIDLDVSAALTGNAIDIFIDKGIAANAIHIDAGAEARTGADILVTDDSTGAHSVIDINSSGSGATVGFDFVGSYNGSPGGQVFLVDLNASDNLDTEVMQLTTGTGDRGIMFDFNLGHTDASTTSHIFDIDFTAVFDSNIIDVAFGASSASTGNILFFDMDNAVAMTAIHIEGSGIRTQPMIEVITDSTGSAQVFDLDITGAGSGNFIDVLVGAVAYTGNVLDIDLGATGTGAQAIVLTSGAMTRTVDAIQVADSGTPSGDVMSVQISGAATGHVFDIDISGIHTGNVLDIVYSAAATGDAVNLDMTSAVAGSALTIVGAGIRTDDLIKIDDASTGNSHIFDINLTDAYTGNVFDVATSAAVTGNVINIDLDAGLAATALRIDSGAGTRTQPVVEFLAEGDGTGAGGTLIDINATGTGATSNPLIDIDVTGVYAGHIFDVALGAASTGNVINIDMDAGLAAAAIFIDGGAGLRTDNLINITDDGSGDVDALAITASNTGSGSVFDIDVTGIRTGNIIDIAMSGAATGVAVIAIDLDAAVACAGILLDAGNAIRTADVIDVTFDGSGNVSLMDVNVTNTGSGNLFDIDISGVHTGNEIDIVYSAAATGSALHVDLGSNLAGNAILIDAAGVRTAPLIYIANTGTDGGTDDHVLFINQTGLLDSNLIQLTFGTEASTGDAIGITMDTNVAGRAITINSAGTGVSGEGCALDITQTANLVAGANVVDINTSGSHSATSHAVSITSSGAGTTGTHALYVNATGANVEAIKVDAGTVTFDETLTVTGVFTGTAAVVLTAGIDAKVIFAGTETIAAGGTSTALDLTKTAHYIDADAGGDTFTLANGTEGQIMVIVCASATGIATITPDTMKGGTSVTLNAAGDTATLAYIGAGWSIVGGNGYSVV